MIIPLYLCKRTLPVICLLTITVQTSFAQTVYTYSCKAYNTYFRGIPSTDKECNYTVKHLVDHGVEGRIGVTTAALVFEMAFSTRNGIQPDP